MAEPAKPWRIVVVAVDPPPTWNLPAASEFTGAPWISGGQQELYELAVAAAAAGHDVELRGEIRTSMLDPLCEAAGARPATPPDERRPDANDIVIISEGGDDPLRFGRLALSPARVVLLILAPTGLFGWPFVAQRPGGDPLTVPLGILGRREHFRAIAALDIDIWAAEGRTYDLATAAGARCEVIGHGNPLGVANEPAVKDIDVAYLAGSRWRDHARQVATLMTRPVHEIAVGGHPAVMAEIARTKVLVWPARIEGHGTVLWEARSVGTVIVGLSSNVYATGLDENSGAIAVRTIEEMPAVVEGVLGDPPRLAELAEAGRRTAAAQIDWKSHVARVDAAIVRVQRRELGPSADARAAFGRRVDDEFVRPRDRLRVELADLSLTLEETRRQLIEVTAALTGARSGSAGGRPRFVDRLAGWTSRARRVFRARN
jgi:hypothetical protein